MQVRFSRDFQVTSANQNLASPWPSTRWRWSPRLLAVWTGNYVMWWGFAQLVESDVLNTTNGTVRLTWHCCCDSTVLFIDSIRLTRNILNCDQSNVLLARIIFFCILLTAFSSFLFTPQMTSSVTWPFDSQELTSYRWSIVTMRLSSTVMEIWPFEVLQGRLYQEQKSVVGRSSVGPQYYTDLIYSSSLP